MVEVFPATAERVDDLAALFASNGTVAGCGCMFFLLTGREFNAGWRNSVNRDRLLAMVGHADPPMGVVAYRGGEPVGWCATGPRSRYGKAMRSPLYRSRDPTEDDAVWLLPCLFVRREARGSGLTHHLLAAAVRLAEAHRASAVEAFPLAGGERRPSGEAYLGTEAMFATLGFQPRERPSDRRVIMRLELPKS
jgi:GNAT superfamily N-acetyltransferase